jgi:hypothetical protein
LTVPSGVFFVLTNLGKSILSLPEEEGTLGWRSSTAMSARRGVAGGRQE